MREVLDESDMLKGEQHFGSLHVLAYISVTSERCAFGGRMHRVAQEEENVPLA